MRMSLLILVATIILLIGSTSQAFVLNVTPTTKTIRVGTSEYIEVRISSDIEDRFIYHLRGFQPWMSVEDIGRVSAGETKIAKIYLAPTLKDKAGIYKLTITVESVKTGEMKTEDVFITVTKDIAIDIEKVSISGDLKPKGKANFDIEIKNVGEVVVSNVKVKGYIGSLKEKLGEFERTLDQLQPNEKKVISEEIDFKPRCAPGKYFIRVQVFYRGEILSEKTQYFEIVSTPVIESITERSFAFIGEKVRIIIINQGNKKSEPREFTYDLGAINSKFFRTLKGPNPAIEDGIARWIIPSLEPGGTMEIEFEINYLPLITVIIIICLALYFLKFKIKTLQVNKTVIQAKRIREGGVYTVSVEMRNNTGKDISSVVIEDEVPMIFKVKGFIGMKPKIKKLDYGTILTWRIRKLKDGEERVLSYKIVPVIGVEGNVRLPRARIKYKVHGKSFKARSSSCYIGL